MSSASRDLTRTSAAPDTGALDEEGGASPSSSSGDLLHHIAERITDAFFALDRDWRFTYLNAHAERLLQRPREELLGRDVWEEFPEAVHSEFHRQYHRALAEQCPVSFEAYYPPLDGWFEVRAHPSDNGLSVFFQDIRERKRAQQALRESEQFLRAVLDSLSAHIAVLDESGIILSVNAAWRHFEAGNGGVRPGSHTGVGSDYLAVTDAAASQGLEDARTAAQGIRDVLAGRREDFELEYECHSATEPRWFLMRVTRFTGPGPMRVVVAHENITGRKMAEEATRRLAREEAAREEAEAARERIHAVLERITDGFVAYDRQWRYTYVNRLAESWFSRGREEMLGRYAWELFPQVVGTPAHALLLRAADTQVPCEAELPSSISDRWLRLVAYPSPEGLSLYFRDITEQRRAEERLRFLSELSATLVRSPLEETDLLQAVARLAVPALADGCALVGDSPLAGRVLGMVAVERELEESLREALGQPPPQAGPVGSALEQAFHSGEAVLQDEERLLALPLRVHERTQGVLVLVHTTSGRRYGPEDVALARELARRTALALENARLYRTALRAIATRDETLGIVAHDLVNPLSAITLLCGTAETYLRTAGESGQRARELLRKVNQAVSQMQQLIEELLTVAQLEAGELSLELEVLDVPQLLSEVRKAHEPLAAARALHLEVEHGPDLPPVYANASRVLRIFQNLVGNALKFTPPGGHIRVRAEEGEGHVRFSISDTGRGIAPENLPHIFDRFWQARHTRHAGVGLGLAIAKGLVGAQGGRIQVESRVGEGTTFTFTLPTA